MFPQNAQIDPNMVSPETISGRPTGGVKRPYRIGVVERSNREVKRVQLRDQLVPGILKQDWERAVDEGFASDVTMAVNGLLGQRGIAPMPAFPMGGM